MSEQSAPDAAVAPVLNELRRRIEHEDGLMNHRVSWLLTSQAFFLTAYAITLNAPPLLDPRLARAHDVLLIVLPWSALVSILLVWAGLLASLRAMVVLRAAAQALDPINGARVQGDPLSRLLGLIPPLGVPLVLAISWGFILLV